VIWYKVRNHKYDDGKWIEPVNVVKETAKTLIIMEDGDTVRVNKRSMDDSYFKSRQEAWLYLMMRKRGATESAKARLVDAQREFNEAKAEEPSA